MYLDFPFSRRPLALRFARTQAEGLRSSYFSPDIKNKTDFILYCACFFVTLHPQKRCDSSSVGRALASQAKGRGFEPRLSLWLLDKGNEKPRELE